MFDWCKGLLSVLNLWPSSGGNVIAVLQYTLALTIEAALLTGLFIYVLGHLDDVYEATEPGLVCFALATTMFIYIWMIGKKSNIESVLDRLEYFVNDRVNGQGSFDMIKMVDNEDTMYEKAEEEHSIVIRRFVYSWTSIVAVYGFILLIEPVYDMYHGQMNARNWTSLFKSSFPIDERKISSFFMHYALDFGVVYIHFTIYSASCTFHVATASYISAMVLDMKAIFNRCDEINENHKIEHPDRDTTVRKMLDTSIKIHMNILTLVKSLAQIMSGILFAIIANTVIFTAVGLLQMESKTKSAAFEVYVSLNSVMLQTALIWLFCYYSALVPMRMNQIADDVYSLHWYNFSISSQTRARMIIQQSNKHFGYSGLGILNCDITTLSMVVKSVVSYYLLLKKI